MASGARPIASRHEPAASAEHLERLLQFHKLACGGAETSLPVVRPLSLHAPERLHEELSGDYNDMIYAATREEIERRRKAFIRKRWLKRRD
jgi:hypothetical protein